MCRYRTTLFLKGFHVYLIRFKQTCFVSTRLDITRSPLSVFARCLFLLAVCFSSLSVFCRLRALRPVSSVYRLTWFMTGVFFFPSQNPPSPPYMVDWIGVFVISLCGKGGFGTTSWENS